MSTVTPSPAPKTFADVLNRLGGVPPDRVRLYPQPGTATIDDLLRYEGRENRSCELVDGTLVEKAMCIREALLAIALGSILREFVKANRLGFVTGPDGTLRLFPNLVRIPDGAFISWQSAPDGRVPDEPVPPIAPDLAVEIISRGNTEREMQRKRHEYFSAGVRQVWIIDPRRRTVEVFTSEQECSEFGESDTLEGDEILPGFSLQLAEFFAELDETAES